MIDNTTCLRGPSQLQDLSISHHQPPGGHVSPTRHIITSGSDSLIMDDSFVSPLRLHCIFMSVTITDAFDCRTLLTSL